MKPILEGSINGNKYLQDRVEKIKVMMEPDNHYFKTNIENDRNNYDKLILINGLEPYEINNIRDSIISNKKYFDRIYSYDQNVLNQCENSELFCFGSCWVLTNGEGDPIHDDEDKFEDFYKIENKKFKVSFIKSWKNQQEGHKLRQCVPGLLDDRNFEVLYPKERIESKHSLFVDSMFHICIENTKHDNYFTEKLIDCFMSKTVPVYWGCPNIGNFFNEKGIIKFDNSQELDRVLSELSPEYFIDNKSIIEDNYERAKEYAFFNKNLDEMITKIL